MDGLNPLWEITEGKNNRDSYTFTHRTLTHILDAYTKGMLKAYTFFNERQEAHVSVMHSRRTVELALFPSVNCIILVIASIHVS